MASKKIAPPATAKPGGIRLILDPAQRPDGALDGAWWPRTRDPMIEVPALVEGLRDRYSTPYRIALSMTGWESMPRRVSIPGGVVRIGWYRSIDDNMASVSTAAARSVNLLVVPLDSTDELADAAMSAAATSHNSARATDVLATAAAAGSGHPEARLEQST
jgi:hypothetical protein